jgi:hypothetical protein
MTNQATDSDNEEQRRANTKAKSKLAPVSPNTNINEHYLRASGGTQTACSCGKTFMFAAEANQHVEWQLRTQALITAAKIAELKSMRNTAYIYFTDPGALAWPPHIIIDKRIKELEKL